MSPPGHHPCFNDQHAVFWHHGMAAGLEAARAEGKLLFVQVGGLRCGGSRALVEKTIPKDEIAEFLRQHFVCVALEPSDPDLDALAAGLPRREPTPLCIYLASDGRLLHSTVGGRPPAVFLSDMAEAAAKAA